VGFFIVKFNWLSLSSILPLFISKVLYDRTGNREYRMMHGEIVLNEEIVTARRVEGTETSNSRVPIYTVLLDVIPV
jgi:hypothetical protein